MHKFSLAIVLLAAGFLNVDHVVESVPQFKRCYNSSEDEMHCFDVQYDIATNQPLITSFQNAQSRCKDMNSTLVTIKNEEIDNLIQQFTKDSNNPVMNQYFWLNAYEVNNYDNSYRWHWLNSTLANLPQTAVSYTYDPGWYTAGLECRTYSDGTQFYLTAKQPIYTFYYVCEYSVSNCVSTSSNEFRLMNGRCYRAVQVLVTWYEARNRCLKNGGELASFENVTSINFTAWLGSVQLSAYWIGLRFTWYTWGDAGQELSYANWATNGGDLQKPCLIYCFNCIPTFSWSQRDCSMSNVYAVCHTVTSIKMTTATFTVETTQTTKLPANKSTFTSETLARKEASTSPSIIPLAVGVGIGVGVPVIAGIAVMIICIVRKRQHADTSSVKSTNRQQAESSFDQPVDDPTGNERDELGESTTYGIVVPSKSPREAAEANEANSPAEQTVYAPLQIL